MILDELDIEDRPQARAARRSVPGPNQVGLLPSPDAHAYPVLTGPPAWAPQELTDRPEPWCGPAAPMPSRALDMTRDADVEAQSFPEPLVRSTDGIAPPVKRGVTDLLKYAEARGWTVARHQYAEGFWAHASTGKPGKAPKESIGIRLERGDQYAVAVYVSGSTWSWDILYLMEAGKPWRRFETLGPFLEAL
jgi:hypothetical protein